MGMISYPLSIINIIYEKLFRPDQQITFIDQPMVKLIRGISTICLTSLPYLFINIRARWLTIQIHLYRTLHILDKIPGVDNQYNHQ